MISAVTDITHPFASVISTELVPTHNAVATSVVSPLFHKYVNGAVPPTTVTVAPPSHSPKQDTLLSTTVVAVPAAPSVIVEATVSVHPCASVTVTLYVPAARLVTLL